MNEEGKELTVDFLMQQLEIEGCNAHHKSLSQLDSSTSINFAAYDHQQNRSKNSKKNRGKGKDQDRNFLLWKFFSIYGKVTTSPFNAKKIQFKQSQVSFYGHCWSKQGFSPDPKKIEALNHMEFPPDKETMRSFLGMMNYLNRYSALSAHLAAPLSALTHQAVDYKPSKEHYDNFNRLKMEVSNMRALPYFDVNAETTLQMNDFKKGLGACIIQKGKVVCYASRALTKTEQNYQNLEREALEPFGEWKSSIISCMERIHIGNQPEATCEYLQETYD